MTDRTPASDKARKLEYLSAAWFDAVDNIVDPRSHSMTMDGGQLIVDYVSGPDTLHHQVFEHGELVAWRPGVATHAHLLFRRPLRVDAGDLLGRISPHAVAAQSRVLVGGHSVDAVGTTGVLRRDLQIEVRELDVRAAVRCHDGPFGRLQVELSIDSKQVAVECGTGDEPPTEGIDVYLSGPYAEFLPWLHGAGLLGHLIHRGWFFHGDLIALSALDGVVSARSVEVVPAHLIETLVAYASARNDHATLAKLDAIEEHTSHAGLD